MTYLITGATGQQGGAVARALLQQGHTFRALSRSAERLAPLKAMGIEGAVGDFEQIAQLEAALEGITRAFLVTTWFEGGPKAEIEQGLQFIEAAKRAGLEHLVFTSVGGASERTGVPQFDSKWEIEQHLFASGIAYTILRPVFFMENFQGPSVTAAMKQGRLALPLSAKTSLQMVALDVIGAFGAAALTEDDRFLGAAIELASDELTMTEVTQKLGQSLGQELVYEKVEASPENVEMYRWIEEQGFEAKIDRLKEWGLPLTTFDQYLQRTVEAGLTF